jgi:outer membrane protein OmpA-like peptidoglycan-associated protein
LINRAAGESNVTQYAPMELQRAQDALQRAQSAWNATGETPEVSHLSYIAYQRGVIAIEMGNQRAAEEAIKLASADRTQLQAEAQAIQAAQAIQHRGTPQKDMAGLQSQNGRSVTVLLPGTLFPSGHAGLPAEALPSLDKLAAILKEHPERKIAIEGFTDSQGDDASNLELSRQRADAVRNALMARGVPASRIIVRPYGSAYPVADNDTSAGREQNRRVEIVLSDPQGNVPERMSASGR